MPFAPPGPASRREEALESSIRIKLEKKEPLTLAERRYLSDVPGRRELTPADVRRMYGLPVPAERAQAPATTTRRRAGSLARWWRPWASRAGEP